MKSTVIATLAGLATAGGSLRSDATVRSSSFSSSIASSLSNNNVKVFNNEGFYQGGANGLAVNSLGLANIGSPSLSSETALSNVGTGAILVTADNNGQSRVASGQVIADGSFPAADFGLLQASSSLLVNNNFIAKGVINNAYANTISPTVSIDSLFSKLPSSS